MDITVAICTYNGARRVPEVLACLERQTGMGDRPWEVVVVDNNSTDDTAAVVHACQAHWKGTGALRYVFEGTQGKAYAIRTAIAEAQGTWVAFLDDDNLPNPDWVAEAVRFAEAHPRAGAFGGQVHGLFDHDLPRSFGMVRSLFAINERAETQCYNAGGTLEFGAPGAGLVVRRQAWLETVPPTGLQRKGPTGSGRGTLGEEFELQWRLHQQGWEIWHNASMHLQHHIPKERFEPASLAAFFRAIGTSRHAVRMLRRPAWQRPFATVAYLAADLKKLIELTWQYRHKLQDPFVRGRRQMLGWMLLRPFRLHRLYKGASAVRA